MTALAVEYWDHKARQMGAHRAAQVKKRAGQDLRLAIGWLQTKHASDLFKLSDAAAMRLYVLKQNPKLNPDGKRLKKAIAAGIRRLSRARKEVPYNLNVGVIPPPNRKPARTRSGPKKNTGR